MIRTPFPHTSPDQAMSRTFAYCRVSTTDQTTDNQVEEIRRAGFDVKPERTLCDVVSGSQSAALRPQFSKLLERMEGGDVLIVTKLDRLGRSVQDVAATIKGLEARGIRVHCLALGGVDLTSAAGKMTMHVLAAVAEFELDLIKERTTAGLERAKAEGKKLGRPAALSAPQVEVVRARLALGETVSQVAREFDVARSIIIRARDSAPTA
jgi:putative DNA-invertase from lambdoid prophage Rac